MSWEKRCCILLPVSVRGFTHNIKPSFNQYQSNTSYWSNQILSLMTSQTHIQTTWDTITLFFPWQPYVSLTSFCFSSVTRASNRHKTNTFSIWTVSLPIQESLKKDVWQQKNCLLLDRNQSVRSVNDTAISVQIYIWQDIEPPMHCGITSRG